MNNVDALSSSAQSILTETLKWPIDERVALVERILGSFDTTDPSADLAWLKEAESRLAAYRSGELVGIDAEQTWLEISQRRYQDLVKGEVQGVPGPPVFAKLRTRLRNLLPLTRQQRAELKRCLRAYEATGKRSRPADDVIAEIRKKL